jgi:hypothetical protein
MGHHIQKISLSRREREILAMALQELRYVAEEGVIRDVCEEAGIDVGDAPDAEDISNLLSRLEPD